MLSPRTSPIRRAAPEFSVTSSSSRLFATAEGWLIVLIPFMAILFGAAMIHVAATMGFTAVGEPAVTAQPSGTGHGG